MNRNKYELIRKFEFTAGFIMFIFGIFSYFLKDLPSEILSSFITMLGFFIGAEYLYENKTKIRLKTVEEEFIRKINELRNAGETYQKIIPNCFLKDVIPNLSGVKLESNMLPTSWIIIVKLKNIEELNKLAEVLTTIEKEKISISKELPLQLYTFFDKPISRKKYKALSKIVNTIIKLTSGNWYFIPTYNYPWKILIWNPFGSVFSEGLRSNEKIWQSLKNASALKPSINKGICYLSENEFPLIISANQILHLSLISHQINKDHTDDFMKSGYHFGNSSHLLSDSGKKMLAGSSVVPFQELENEAFNTFVEELLEKQSEVTSYWPIFGKSLRYVTSPAIENWHTRLNKAVLRKKNSVKANRYLVVHATKENGRFEIREDLVPITILEDDSENIIEVKYKRVIECVIGKYFWETLSNKNFNLFVIPILSDEFDSMQSYFIKQLKEIDPSISLSFEEDLLNAMQFDWIMLSTNSKSGSNTIVQFDESIAFRKCAAPAYHIPNEEKCSLSDSAYSKKLLVHRYEIANSFPPESCETITNCILNEKNLSQFCCLKKIFQYTSHKDTNNIFKPRNFLNKEIFSATFETIKNNSVTNYYNEPLVKLLKM